MNFRCLTGHAALFLGKRDAWSFYPMERQQVKWLLVTGILSYRSAVVVVVVVVVVVFSNKKGRRTA